jgi:hypothetical protein
MSFAYRIPVVAGTATIQLVGPQGVLDARRFSSARPTVTVTSPKGGAVDTLSKGRVHVTWKASDSNRDPLLYSVLYSPDNGQSWLTEA